jgi:hypothetical protein
MSIENQKPMTRRWRKKFRRMAILKNRDAAFLLMPFFYHEFGDFGRHTSFQLEVNDDYRRCAKHSVKF